LTLDPAAVRRDAEREYRAAMRQLRDLRREWTRQGKPVLAYVGETGRPLKHPLFVLIQDQQRLCARLRDQLRVRHRGPDPVAVIEPAGTDLDDVL